MDLIYTYKYSVMSEATKVELLKMSIEILVKENKELSHKNIGRYFGILWSIINFHPSGK